MNRFRQILQSKRNSKETGNSLVVFIMMFPVIFSVFGLAIDISIANYLQKGLTDTIANATQITISQAQNPVNSAVPMLNKAQAYDQLVTVYATNTGRSPGGSMMPFLKCQTKPLSGSKLPDAPIAQGCLWSENSGGFKYSNTVANGIRIEYKVTETSATIFLGMIGINQLKYNLEGFSQTSFSHEQG